MQKLALQFQDHSFDFFVFNGSPCRVDLSCDYLIPFSTACKIKNMITLLLILYLKKKKHLIAFWWIKLRKYMPLYFKILLLFLSAILYSKFLYAQTIQYEFEVKKSDKCIGSMNITHCREGLFNTIILRSEIKYRFLFLFQASSKEEAMFYDGILTHSSLYRQQSGSKTINQQIRRVENHYMIICGGNNRQETKIFPITFHILCMYTTEPSNNKEVFIDKIQQMVLIKKMAEHHYRIELPDGNYNDYYYENGYCKLIKVHQTLIDVEIALKSIKSL